MNYFYSLQTIFVVSLNSFFSGMDQKQKSPFLLLKTGFFFYKINYTCYGFLLVDLFFLNRSIGFGGGGGGVGSEPNFALFTFSFEFLPVFVSFLLFLKGFTLSNNSLGEGGGGGGLPGTGGCCAIATVVTKHNAAPSGSVTKSFAKPFSFLLMIFMVLVL